MEREDKNKILASQGIRLVPQEKPLRPTSRLVDPLSGASIKDSHSKSSEAQNISTASTAVGIQSAQLGKIADSSEPKTTGLKPRRISLLKIAILFFTVLIVGYGIYFAAFSLDMKSLLSNRNSSSEIIREVGKIVELPQDESPSVMTITDLEPLASQTFFKDAKVGDKVLMYSSARKAVLYRPAEKRVVSIANLSE